MTAGLPQQRQMTAAAIRWIFLLFAAVLMVLAGVSVAHAADSARPFKRGVLKLPTPAGQIVSDVLGQRPMQLGAGEDPADSAAVPALDRHGDAKPAIRPGHGQRRAWVLRGWVSSEDPELWPEHIGAPSSSLGINSWRFDASLIRAF